MLLARELPRPSVIIYIAVLLEHFSCKLEGMQCYQLPSAGTVHADGQSICMSERQTFRP